MSNQRETDIATVTAFILGWWPGLEGGLKWPDDADEPEKNSVYAAATRLSQEVLPLAAAPSEALCVGGCGYPVEFRGDLCAECACEGDA